MTTTRDEQSSPALVALRADKTTRDHAEISMLRHTIEWCVEHECEDLDEAAFGDHGIPLAGEGAPLVSEFAVMELAAALGMSSDSGMKYVGTSLELRYRLPRLWVRVISGKLPVWRARRIAETTMSLPQDGALFVDARIAHVAHSCSFAQLDRLVEEALVRFDPETAEAKRLAALDGRHLSVHAGDVSYNGTVEVSGTLDLADALDLDKALAHGAATLAALGSTDSIDVRRSIAAGEMARGQLGFEVRFAHTSTTDSLVEARAQRATTCTEERAKRASRSEPSEPRSIVLYVHLCQDAIARVENTRSPISVEQVKTWCGNDNAKITVRPVIDLAEQIYVGAYEIPERLKEQVNLRDGHCVFPHCRRPARGCDTDHIQPFDRDGTTSTENLATLCRRHHRLKTHGGWTYQRLNTTTYEWKSPHGLVIRRDHHGTHAP